MLKELWAEFWNSKAGKTCCFGFLGLGLSILLTLIGVKLGWVHGHSFYVMFVLFPLFLTSEIAALGGVLVYFTLRSLKGWRSDSPKPVSGKKVRLQLPLFDWLHAVIDVGFMSAIAFWLMPWDMKDHPTWVFQIKMTHWAQISTKGAWVLVGLSGLWSLVCYGWRRVRGAIV